ncbi:putative mediator of RNA polymerase II transcription subunit 26 isoform X1 [Argonauta hians]
MWSSKDEEGHQDSLNTVMVLAQKLKLSKPDSTSLPTSFNNFCCGDIKITSSPHDHQISSPDSNKSVWRFNRCKSKAVTLRLTNGVGNHSCEETMGSINGELSPILRTRNQINRQRYPLKSQTAVDIDSDIDETESSNDSDYSDIYTSDDCCKEPPLVDQYSLGYNSSKVEDMFNDRKNGIYSGKSLNTSTGGGVNKNNDIISKEDVNNSARKGESMHAKFDITCQQTWDISPTNGIQTPLNQRHSTEKNKDASAFNRKMSRILLRSRRNVSFTRSEVQQNTSREAKDSPETKYNNSHNRIIDESSLNENHFNNNNINGLSGSESSSLDNLEGNQHTLSGSKYNVFKKDNHRHGAEGTLLKDAKVNDSKRQHSETETQDFGQKLNILQEELVHLRQHDERLATQFLQIYRDIQILKVQRACESHQDLLDDAIDEVEERDRLIDLCDTPPLKYSDSKLRHCGLTKMNICSRRFSCS